MGSLTTVRKYHRNIKVAVQVVDKLDEYERRLNRQFDSAMRYILGAIRNQARWSIKTSSGRQPYSLPGNPVKTHPPNRVYKKTIFRDYDPIKKIGWVGPKREFDWKAPYGAKFRPDPLPALLEYGGVKVVPRAQPIPKGRATARMLNDEVRRQRKRNPHFKKSDIKKYVWLPPGTYRIAARPTMRLALNKTVIQTNEKLVKAFNVARRHNAAPMQIPIPPPPFGPY